MFTQQERDRGLGNTDAGLLNTGNNFLKLGFKPKVHCKKFCNVVLSPGTTAVHKVYQFMNV